MAVHSTGIRDSGTRFQIVPNTRKIVVPQSHKVIGVVGDHLSEQVTFQCPKLIDGHDIKGCTDHYLSWETPSGECGSDHLELVAEDEEFLVYAWNIRGNTTIEAGVVAFSVHFKCVSSSGAVLYHWGTHTCKDCEILGCVNHALGIYELIYVDGDTLVISDYTPVRDESIMLETPGIVPEGTNLIETNGHHDVAGLASVDVAVPNDKPITVEVQEGGLIIATDGTPQNVTTLQMDAPTVEVDASGLVKAKNYGMETTHQLDASDDADFRSANIVEGATIFGITGRYPKYCVPQSAVRITNKTAYRLTVVYEFVKQYAILESHATSVDPGDVAEIFFATGTDIEITAYKKADQYAYSVYDHIKGRFTPVMYTNEAGIGFMCIDTHNDDLDDISVMQIDISLIEKV